jgi:peptidoglycan hydrolase CwlO-like protein
MANIKNFGIVGVGSGVQFGKGGAQLIQTSGTFAAKNAAGNAFVRFQIADGASDGDAITFNQLTNAVTLIDANAAAIQSELNNTQVGAGLAEDGSYTPPEGSNYLTNATSLANAAAALDTALFAETTARIDGDNALANTIANATSGLGMMQAEIDQIETSVGLGTDGTLTLAAGNYLANAIDLVGAIETLDGVLGQTNSDLANVTSDVDGFTQDISDLSNAVAGAEANVVALSGRVDLVEANSIAQGGLIDDLRTDVDANSALLQSTIANVATNTADIANNTADIANNTSDISDLDGRVTALENADYGNAIADVAQDLLDETNARVAADSALASDIANVVSDVVDVEAEVSALSANAVLKDGSVMMTGTFDLGGNIIANVATPNAASDAANKDYVDTKVATLGNAFNYIGTLAGGPDAANAFVLEDNIIPADRSAGDYYKVTTAGYFVMEEGDTANAAYFNVNDGLVFNTGGTFDKIDNTDSVVTGTVAEITVTGSVDTGFVVGIDGAYTAARQQEVSDEANSRANADDLLAQNISDETNARVAADSALASDIANVVADLDALEGALEAEIANTNANVAVVAADLANTNANVASLDGRVTALENNDDLSNAIAELEAEIANTNANVAVVAADLANTNSNVATVVSDLNDEISRATQAESDLSNAIADTNANVALVAADLANTDANVATVASDVANAQAEIDAIETGAGLGADGSYTANASSHYLANATTLKSADEFLDTALFELANTVATLSQDTIKTIDGLNSVHVADDLITMSLNVGGNAVAVANVVAGANTNTNLVMDFTNADEIKLAAFGDSADVDLRLIAQGQGHVIIGETGVGVIQADDGYDMTVAAGTGANLNLIGALVDVRDEANNLITQFAGAGGATAYSTLTNGNTSVSFGAAGAETDIDLVFAPKGAGTVNMSSARVVNVANATASTDAVNKGQLDTAISTAAVGVVKTAVATLPATSGTVNIGEITGTVLRIRVLINNAYDDGSTITVGTTGTPNDLAADTDIDESTPGIYVIETAKDYSAQTVTATVTNATGENGAAKVVVEYLTA